MRDAHIAYIRAGAQVITTNNYAVVPGTLALSKGKYTSSDLEMVMMLDTKNWEAPTPFSLTS